MLEIWKYTLHPGVQDVAMPEDSLVLTVQLQQGIITLWARVKPSAPTSIRTFVVLGTGQPFANDRLVYIGTVQDHWLVWHVLEDRGLR